MREGVEKYGRLPLREDVWAQFAAGLQYVSYTLNSADGFDHLKQALETADRERGTAGNRLLYFSTPPNASRMTFIRRPPACRPETETTPAPSP